MKNLASGQFWLLTASASDLICSGLIIENIYKTNYSKLLTLQQTVVVYLVLGLRISISHARKEYWWYGKVWLVVCWCESMVIRDYSPSAIFRNSRPVSHKSRSAGWKACSSIITLTSDFSQITITLAWEQKEYENMTLLFQNWFWLTPVLIHRPHGLVDESVEQKGCLHWTTVIRTKRRHFVLLLSVRYIYPVSTKSFKTLAWPNISHLLEEWSRKLRCDA